MNDTITPIPFKGKQYPTRTLTVGTYVLIGTESLSEAMDWEGEDYDLAQKFYFYVEEDKIDLPAEDLLRHLKDEHEADPNLELHNQPFIEPFFSGIT